MSRTDAHDAWVKSTLKVDPAAPPGSTSPAPPPDAASSTAAPSTSAPSTPLAAAGQDKQSQAFHEAVQRELAAVDEHLTYTAANAEADKHASLATRREQVVAAYPGVAKQIDPAAEAKAKPAIDKMIALVQGLKAQAGQLHQTTQKAVDAWTAKAPAFEASAKGIGEMVAWGHAKAPPLQTEIDALRAKATARKYTEASVGFDKLQNQAKPVTEDYTKQRAAQETYDAAKKAIADRVAAATACPFKKLEALRKPCDADAAPMQAAEQSKDYVHALKLQTGLATKLTAFEAKRTEIEGLKKAYDDEAKKIDDRAGEAAQSSYKTLEPMQKAVDDAKATMKATAETEDFPLATRQAVDVGAKLDACVAARKQLDEFKAKLEKAMTDLKTKLDTVGKPPHPKLKPDEDRIAQSLAAIEAAKADDKFDSGLAQTEDLTKQLVIYADAVAKLAAAKEAQDKKFKETCAPGLDKMYQSFGDERGPLQKTMLDLKEKIDEDVKNEDYDAAGSKTDALAKQIADFEKMDKDKVYAITWNSKEYRGTAEEVADLRMKMVAAMANGAVEPLRHKAESHDGYLKDLQANDSDHFVVAFVFNTFLADHKAFEAACAAQGPAIAALDSALHGDLKTVGTAYEAAVAAVRKANDALSAYMQKLDSRGQKLIFGLEVVEKGSFLLLAALATPVIIGATAGALGATGAGALAAAGSGAITQLGKEADKFANLKEVTLKDVVVNVSRAALIDGASNIVGGKLGSMLKQQVLGKLFERYAIENPTVRKKLTEFVEKQAEKQIKKAFEALVPDGEVKKKLTWAEVGEKMVEDFGTDKLNDQVKEWGLEVLKEEAAGKAK